MMCIVPVPGSPCCISHFRIHDAVAPCPGGYYCPRIATGGYRLPDGTGPSSDGHTQTAHGESVQTGSQTHSLVPLSGRQYVRKLQMMTAS